MPPQSTPPTPPPTGQFDFMMKDQPKPPGRFGSLLSGIPRPAKIALTSVGVLIILVILYSLLFGGKTTNVDQLTAVAARAQEITRVSTLAQTGSQNTDTQELAATTSKVLTSQEQELKTYLKTSGVKVDTKKLAARLNKDTDAQLLIAQQNNNYDQAYLSYLKASLLSYQSDIVAASQGATKNAVEILAADLQSVQTLLSAPSLSSN